MGRYCDKDASAASRARATTMQRNDSTCICNVHARSTANPNLRAAPYNDVKQRDHRQWTGRIKRSTGNAGTAGRVTAMNKEIAALQKLLDALNDSSILFRRLAARTTSSHFGFLLERAVSVHRWIADELADRVTTAGGTPRPGGSLLGPLHALRANWPMRNNPDMERAHLARAARREDGVLQCFVAAVAAVTDVGLRDRLQTHMRQIERACMQMKHLGPAPPIPVYAKPTPPSTGVAVQQPGLRTTVQVPGHV